jgi:uncharacterized protein (TIGR00255 family)
MRSMTGYGSSDVSFPGGQVHAELRAVNHRFLEIRLALPREFHFWEQEWRKLIETHVKRGKLELTLTFSGKSSRSYMVNPNVDLVRAYREAIVFLQRDLGVNGELDMSFLISRPEFFQVAEKPQPAQAEVQAARQAVQHAITALEGQRSREGKFLERDLRKRVLSLEKTRRTIVKRSSIVLQMSRKKLMERVTPLLQGVQIEQSRLLQEVVALTQKSDITEEVVRLGSHLEALSDTLRLHEPVGKRIDFLLQEIQREVNTIGAKAEDTMMRHLVVAAKEEVEKLREQVQNVE